MSSVDLWLPESYRRREEEVRARGGVVAVTGRDVGLAPVTYGKVREFASGLVIETALPRLAAFMLVMGPGVPRVHAELRAVQIRAAREFLPPPYRERAIRFLEAGRHDIVFCQEQLLLAMRLVIEHGLPGPPGEIDKLGMARLLLGVTDLMVSGEGLESGPAEDVAIALALRRLGLPGAEKITCEIARWYDLLVTRVRAAGGTPGAMDLDVVFQAATGLEIEDFLAIAWMHAAPLYHPRSPQDLAAAGFHTVLRQPASTDTGIRTQLRPPQHCSSATWPRCAIVSRATPPTCTAHRCDHSGNTLTSALTAAAYSRCPPNSR